MKQAIVLFAGFGLAVLVGLTAGCNNGNDDAKRAQAMQSMLGNNNNAASSQPATQTQAPPPTEPNPCSQTTEDGEEAEYTGPKVMIKEFVVKLPYEGFEGSRRFEIRCEVQAEGSGTAKGIWDITAFDAEGKGLGSQELHLVIPTDEFRPLILNSFYCAQVPASLEFRLTDKTAKKVGEGADPSESAGGPVGVGIR